MIYQHKRGAARELCIRSVPDSPEVRILAKPKLIVGEKTVVCLTRAKPHSQTIQTVSWKTDFRRKNAGLICQYRRRLNIHTHNVTKSSWRGEENNFRTTGSHIVRSTPPALTDKVNVCWPEYRSTGSTLTGATFKFNSSYHDTGTYAMIICKWTEQASR
jgi:hypothetical protein